MSFSVVIPTRGSHETIKKLSEMIDQQTVQPEKVFFVIDRKTDEKEKNFFQEFNQEKFIFITDQNSEFRPQQGISYVRNFGAKQTLTKYLFFIDDDNERENSFFEEVISEYNKVKTTLNKEIVFSPLIIYRHTGKIQSAGIERFIYWLGGRPRPRTISGRKQKMIQKVFGLPQYRSEKNFHIAEMIGGNSLFGQTEIFKKFSFDEEMGSVFEDIECTHRIYRSGIPIVVSNNVKIYHMERDKTLLEKKFYNTPDIAYKKFNNKIFFVKKYGNFFEQTQFFLIGLPISIIEAIFCVLRYSQKQKILIIKKIFLGIYDGIIKKTNGFENQNHIHKI